MVVLFWVVGILTTGLCAALLAFRFAVFLRYYSVRDCGVVISAFNFVADVFVGMNETAGLPNTNDTFALTVYSWVPLFTP